jgi:hypothetical protein
MEKIPYLLRIVADIRTEFGVDVSEVVEKGILHPVDSKKWLVKQLYFKWAKSGKTFTDIKYELSYLHNISVSSIGKIVYRN